MDIQDQWSVEDKMVLSEEETINIVGGFKFSATLLNAFARSFSALLELGRSFGTTLRMFKEGKYCSL